MQRNFTKDTLFNDLPQNIKMQIVELRNAGQMQHPHSISHPLKELGYIPVPTAKSLQEEFQEMAQKIENLSKPKKDIAKEFSEAVKEFNLFVENYKMNIDNKDIMGEVEKTIKMLECRLKELKK